MTLDGYISNPNLGWPVPKMNQAEKMCQRPAKIVREEHAVRTTEEK
jgi:hypothetical protein